MKRRLFALGAVLLTTGHSGCIPYTPSTANYPSDWNPKQIEWQPYALGLRAAAREHKPIVLVDAHGEGVPHPLRHAARHLGEALQLDHARIGLRGDHRARRSRRSGSRP